MIVLHHCRSARSFRPLWALEELGLAYELNLMPFPPRARVEGYLDLNPLGTVPVLQDGATVMTESAAMLPYLAAKAGPTPLAVAPDEPAFGAYLNFLVMGEATLTFPQTLVLRYRVLEPEERRLPQAAEDYERWFLSRLKGAAQMLGEHYACADRFTLADISVGYALRLADTIGLADRFPDKIAAYYARLQARAAYQRALVREADGPQLPFLT